MGICYALFLVNTMVSNGLIYYLLWSGLRGCSLTKHIVIKPIHMLNVDDQLVHFTTEVIFLNLHSCSFVH